MPLALYQDVQRNYLSGPEAYNNYDSFDWYHFVEYFSAETARCFQAHVPQIGSRLLALKSD